MSSKIYTYMYYTYTNNIWREVLDVQCKHNIYRCALYMECGLAAAKTWAMAPTMGVVNLSVRLAMANPMGHSLEAYQK